MPGCGGGKTPNGCGIIRPPVGGGGGPTGTGNCPEMRGLTPNVAGVMEDWRRAMDDAGSIATPTLSDVPTSDFVFDVAVDTDAADDAIGMLLLPPLSSLISRTVRSLGRFTGGEGNKGSSVDSSSITIAFLTKQEYS